MAVNITTEKQIWNYLSNQIKNDFGVAGLMGNLYAESGLYSTNLQNSFEKKLGMTDKQYTEAVNDGSYENFISDKAGYGLAQWTYYTRKQKLLEFAITKNVSIGNLSMQLEFLIEELKTLFPKVLETLKTATSIDQASNIVLLEFEKPADTSAAVKSKRIDYSIKYYNKYATNKVTAAAAKEKNTQTSVIQTATPATKYNLTITNAFGTNNTNYKANRNPQWIVIHYTAGTSSKAGSALNLANGAKTGGLNTSAEFYVDDSTVVQYIQDIPNRYSWSVGGSKYPSMSTSLGGKYYGQCTNQNSINIEICNEKINKKSYQATDTDWYFTDAAVNNAVALTKYLMNKYNIDIDHVIMHHMVTGKLCPAMWTINEAALKNWYNFLDKVKSAEVTLTNQTSSPVIGNTSNYQSKLATTQPTSTAAVSFKPYLIQVAVAALNVRDGAGTQYKVNTIIRDKESYTIVEEKNGWGKLKSGAGWINLNYTKKI